MLLFSSAIYSENTLDYYDIAWVVQEVFHGRCVYTNKGITGNKLVFFLPLVPSRRSCVAGIPPSLLLLTICLKPYADQHEQYKSLEEVDPEVVCALFRVVIL